MEAIESRKIQIATIHDIEGAGLRDQVVENIDVLDFSRGDFDERRDIAAQIQEGVKFDSAFVLSETRPRE